MGLEYNGKPYDSKEFGRDLMAEAHQVAAKAFEEVGTIVCPDCKVENHLEVKPGQGDTFSAEIKPGCCPKVKALFEKRLGEMFGDEAVEIEPRQ